MTTSVIDHDTTLMPPTPPDGDDGDDNVIHIVGWWQWVLDVLRIKAPRALCGVSMLADANPDARPLHPGDPVCAVCQARNIADYRDPSTSWVSARRYRPWTGWAITTGAVIGLIAGMCVLVLTLGITPVVAVCCGLGVIAAAGLLALLVWSGVWSLRRINSSKVVTLVVVAVVAVVVAGLLYALRHPDQASTAPPEPWR